PCSSWVRYVLHVRGIPTCVFEIGASPRINTASALFGNRRLNVDALILNSASPRDAYFELFVQRDTFAHKIVFAPELPWRQRLLQLRAKLVFEHVTRAKPFHCDMFFPKITVERRLTRDL